MKVVMFKKSRFLLAFILIPIWSMTPEDGAPSTSDIPVAKSSASSPAQSDPNKRFFERFRAFPRYLKADDYIQEIGRWAQDEIGIPRKEQSAIWIDRHSSATPIGWAEASYLDDGCIILCQSTCHVAHGALVYTLLSAAKDKADKIDKLFTSRRNKILLFDVLAGIAIYYLPLPWETFGTYFTKTLLTGAVATFHMLTGKAAMEADALRHQEYDTKICELMRCRACVREAAVYRPPLHLHLKNPDTGYLSRERFDQRATELASQHGALCNYHSGNG